MRGTTTYTARDGKVIARTPEGDREVATALGTGGLHLERFERALCRAKAQREARIK